MARGKESPYIQFHTGSYYTAGSTARAAEYPDNRPKPRQSAPRAKRKSVVTIRLDPLALCAIGVAAVLFVMLSVSFFRFLDAQAEREVMARYVQTLEQTNGELEQTYRSGYDLKEVAEQARQMGLVPQSQVQTVKLDVPLPEAEPLTFWEWVRNFFTELLA